MRAARAWAQEHYGVSVWEVAGEDLEAAVLRQRYDAVVDGRIDPAGRLRPPDADTLEPTVAVRPEASAHATVLEVRAADRPGVVYLVCAALAGLGIAVRSAHVDTLGPQAVDVFYLQEDSAGVLGDDRAARPPTPSAPPSRALGKPVGGCVAAPSRPGHGPVAAEDRARRAAPVRLDPRLAAPRPTYD